MTGSLHLSLWGGGTRIQSIPYNFFAFFLCVIDVVFGGIICGVIGIACGCGMVKGIGSIILKLM